MIVIVLLVVVALTPVVLVVLALLAPGPLPRIPGLERDRTRFGPRWRRHRF